MLKYRITQIVTLTHCYVAPAKDLEYLKNKEGLEITF